MEERDTEKEEKVNRIYVNQMSFNEELLPGKIEKHITKEQEKLSLQEIAESVETNVLTDLGFSKLMGIKHNLEDYKGIISPPHTFIFEILRAKVISSFP